MSAAPLAAQPPEPCWPRAFAALAGVLSAAVTLGVAELLAALIGPQSSPVIAVGGAAIDHVPTGLKEFAIRSFGTADKAVLVGGILVVLAVLAAALGVLARRRAFVGDAGVAVLGIVGAIAAATRADASALAVVPSLLGAICGALALRKMCQRLRTSVAFTPKRAESTDGDGRGAGGALRRAADRLRADAASRDRTRLDRRGFFIAGGVSAAVAVVAGGGGRLLLAGRLRADESRQSVVLPAAASPAPPARAGLELKVPGLSPFRTPNANFYRIDTSLVPPSLVAADWTLRIHGMVRREIMLSFADLLARDLIERDITLTCVSNAVGDSYVGNARWLGAPLKPLLEEAGVLAGADQLVSVSTDGFTAGSPVSVLTDGRDAMLAVAMNGKPLPVRHGFPVRIVVPGLYGYVSATKWVTELKLTKYGATMPYWEQRGWGRYGPIKTESRIDTPRNGDSLRARTVPIAGVAWAQHTGIAKVEVRVDESAWQTAKLSDEDTIDTWRQWVYPWPATAGQHRIEVRATDKSGYTQTAKLADVLPDGATGWHTINVTVQ